MTNSNYAAGWEDACLIAARLLEDEADEPETTAAYSYVYRVSAEMMRKLSMQPQNVAAVLKVKEESDLT